MPNVVGCTYQEMESELWLIDTAYNSPWERRYETFRAQLDDHFTKLRGHYEDYLAGHDTKLHPAKGNFQASDTSSSRAMKAGIMHMDWGMQREKDTGAARGTRLTQDLLNETLGENFGSNPDRKTKDEILKGYKIGRFGWLALRENWKGMDAAQRMQYVQNALGVNPYSISHAELDQRLQKLPLWPTINMDF
jgi:hypothetical protein